MKQHACKDPLRPFTPDEQEVMDLITRAHNKFCELAQGSEAGSEYHSNKWMSCIHGLQEVLIYRTVKRDYPNFFK